LRLGSNIPKLERMKQQFLAAGLAWLTLTSAGVQLQAQDAAAQAAAIHERKETEERFRSLEGLVQQLQEANLLLSRKSTEQSTEIHALREQLREEQSKALGNLASREELKKFAEKIQEVDRKREGDNRMMIERMEKLAKIAASAPPPLIPRAPTQKSEVSEVEGDFFKHKVKTGESLSKIIAAYNAALREKGKSTVTIEMVKRANPAMDANNIIVGRTILIPVPPEK